jgi:excisionase family DNA binding protein
MSAFVIPPLPGGPLLSVRDAAQRAGCSEQAIYNFVQNGRIAAVRIAGRLLIAESEADRFIREWPTKNRGVSNRWREYREFRAPQAREAAA